MEDLIDRALLIGLIIISPTLDKLSAIVIGGCFGFVGFILLAVKILKDLK